MMAASVSAAQPVSQVGLSVGSPISLTAPVVPRGRRGVAPCCRVGLLNVGGLESNWDRVVLLGRALELDVLLVTETHLADTLLAERVVAALMAEKESVGGVLPFPPASYFKFANYDVQATVQEQAQQGDSPVGAGLAPMSKRGRDMGGVAAISLNADVALRMKHASVSGVMALDIHKRGFQPLGVVVVYAPPTKRARVRSSVTAAAAMKAAAQQVVQMQQKHGDHLLVAGDFNRHAYDLQGLRLTQDGRCLAGGRQPVSRQPDATFCTFLMRHGLLPVHGLVAAREEDTAVVVPATTTSRHTSARTVPEDDTRSDGEWGAESDYILASRALAEKCSPIPAPPWASHEEGGADFSFTTHRPISVDVPWVRRRATGSGGAYGQSNSPSQLRQVVRRFRPHPFVHGTWKVMGEALHAKLHEEGSVLQGILADPGKVPGPPAALIYREIQGALRGAAETAERVVGGPPVDAIMRQTILHYVSSSGQPTRRRRAPPGSSPLPLPIVGLWQHYDDVRHALAAAERVLKALMAPYDAIAGRPPPPHTGEQAAGIRGDIRVLSKERKRARKAAREASKTARKAFLQGLRSDLEGLRKHDAHGLHRLMRRLSPEGKHSPMDNQGASSEGFMRHFRDLVGVARQDPLPGMDPTSPWWRHVQQAGITAEARVVAGRGLVAEVQWDEVYHVIFPPDVHVPLVPCQMRMGAEGGPRCALCQGYCDEHDRWTRGMTEEPGRYGPPVFKPRLNTSRSGGPDGIPPELLRWASMPDRQGHVDTLLLRREVCTVLASYMNAALKTGELPPEALEYSSTALFKAPKPGQQADPLDPADYRFLTMGNVLTKAFDLVLCTRITHWTARFGLLGREQIGFRQAHGCPWHVFTLVEVIKFRWRQGADGLPTFCLFIDLKKAYDMVHPEALWQQLEHRGMPVEVVRLLRYKSEHRATRLYHNGRQSDSIHMAEGVGQGCPLSPILFNLFIEPLCHALRSDPRLKGVRLQAGLEHGEGLHPFVNPEPRSNDRPFPQVSSVRVLNLTYADDMVLLASSPAELQVALQVVCNWCAAFGMSLSTGKGKTEAMMFPASHNNRIPTATGTRTRCGCGARDVVGGALVGGSTALPAPLVARSSPTGTLTVQWVQQYRYLGFIMNPELCTCVAAAKCISTMRGLWYQYFVGNRQLLKRASPTLALQLLKSIILTSSGYLLDVIRPNEATTKALDELILHCSRWACRLPRNATMNLTLAETRALLAEDYILRDRTRLMMQMTHPHPAATFSLARDVFQVLAVEDRVLVSRALHGSEPVRILPATAYWRFPRLELKPHPSWVRTMMGLLAHAFRELEIRPPDLDQVVDVPRVGPQGHALAHPHSTAYLHAAAQAAVYGRTVAIRRWQARGMDAEPAGRPPAPSRPGATPREVASYLYGRYRQPVENAGDWPGLTTLSSHGPGASGGILSLVAGSVPQDHLRALQRIKMGRMGLFMAPTCPPALRFRPPPGRGSRRGRGATNRASATHLAVVEVVAVEEEASNLEAEEEEEASDDEELPLIDATAAPHAGLEDLDWEAIAVESNGEGGFAQFPSSNAQAASPTSSGQASEGGNVSTWISAAHGTDPCPLTAGCMSGRKPYGTWHVLVECEAPAVRARRRRALRKLPKVMHALACDLGRAWKRVAGVPWRETFVEPALPSPAYLKKLVRRMDWRSEDGKFCLFHLLCGSPWSVWHVRRALPHLIPAQDRMMALPLCMILGIMFDKTRCPHNMLRRSCHKWIRWAGEAVHDVCRQWGEDFSLTSLGVALQHA